MKKVYEVKIDILDFGLFHLKFRNSLFLRPSEDLRPGILIRLMEFEPITEYLTGRNIIVELVNIDKREHFICGEQVWFCELKFINTPPAPLERFYETQRAVPSRVPGLNGGSQ